MLFKTAQIGMIVGFAFTLLGALWRGLGNLPLLYGIAVLVTATLAVVGIWLVRRF